MKKRLLSLCLVGVLCFTLTGCGSTDFSTAEFNGETISLGEDESSVDEKYGAFATGSYIEDDEDHQLKIEWSDDETISVIGADNYNGEVGKIGNLSPNASIDEVSDALGLDKNDIGNNVEYVYFFNEDNEMILSLPTAIPEDYVRNDYDLREKFSGLDDILEFYAPQYQNEFDNSKYALEIEITDGKLSSIFAVDVQMVAKGKANGWMF